MGFFTKEVETRYGTETEINYAKVIPAGVLSLVTIMVVMSMFNSLKMGYTYVYQNSVTGDKTVYHGPDFIIRPPFVSTLTEYKDDTTLSFAEDDGDGATSEKPPIKVAFADTYKASINMNARAVLPTNDEHMLALHKSFRSYKNLVSSLYTKTMVDVAVNTATQFTAEEVFQGGLNGLKSAIEDQANDGVYVTQRKKVLSTSGVTDRTEIGEKKTSSKTSRKAVYVWKAIPKKAKNGEFIRTSNPFEKYGVTISQVNLAEPVPETLLENLLSEKKRLVGKKIASIQKQENAKTDIETSKLEGEAKRVKAEQERLIKADAEVIELKKQVKVAEQQALKEIVEKQKEADLAIIEKGKELQIAEANEGIQRANYKAATFEAKAIKETGIAKADVKKAMYLAVKKDILELEVEKVTQLAKYKALEKAKIQMPTTVMMGGGDAQGSNGLQELTNLHIMDKIK